MCLRCNRMRLGKEESYCIQVFRLHVLNFTKIICRWACTVWQILFIEEGSTWSAIYAAKCSAVREESCKRNECITLRKSVNSLFFFFKALCSEPVRFRRQAHSSYSMAIIQFAPHPVRYSALFLWSSAGFSRQYRIVCVPSGNWSHRITLPLKPITLLDWKRLHGTQPHRGQSTLSKPNISHTTSLPINPKLDDLHIFKCSYY